MMKNKIRFNTVCLFLCGMALLSSCVDYDAEPFDGKTLPRKSGYSTGVTNDWLYFNLRTGEIFNETGVNKEIKEGDQKERTDWDF